MPYLGIGVRSHSEDNNRVNSSSSITKSEANTEEAFLDDIRDTPPSWIDPILGYLLIGAFPKDAIEARKMKLKSLRFWVSLDEKLYRKSFSRIYQLCIPKDKVQ